MHRHPHWATEGGHEHRGLFPRDSSGGGVSNQTVIIIAVCCSVGGCILGIVIWKLIRALRSNSAPLPPPQPLARHREQYEAELEQKRPPIWTQHSSSRNSMGSEPLHLPRGFETSDSSVSAGPSRYPSFQTDESFHGLMVENALPLPNPLFRHDRSSYGSGSGSAEDQTSRPETPNYSDPSASQSNFSDPSGQFLSPRPRPNARQLASRPRPSSTASVTSTINRQRNTIRGSAHSPHSNIQIVIPGPLAPQLSPYRSRHSIDESRPTYADGWTSPNRSTTNVHNPAAASRESLARPRRISSATVSEPMSDSPTTNRVHPPSSFARQLSPPISPITGSPVSAHPSTVSPPPVDSSIPLQNIPRVTSTESFLDRSNQQIPRPPSKDFSRPNRLTKPRGK